MISFFVTRIANHKQTSSFEILNSNFKSTNTTLSSFVLSFGSHYITTYKMSSDSPSPLWLHPAGRINGNCNQRLSLIIGIYKKKIHIRDLHHKHLSISFLLPQALGSSCPSIFTQKGQWMSPQEHINMALLKGKENVATEDQDEETAFVSTSVHEQCLISGTVNEGKVMDLTINLTISSEGEQPFLYINDKQNPQFWMQFYLPFDLSKNWMSTRDIWYEDEPDSSCSCTK
jgi:hypothetical protein